jgi:galactoside O-acetyltransferase
MSLLSEQELATLGLRAVGEDVRIHPSVQFFGPEHVAIGSHVRIDCFAVITAGPEPVTIGDHVHLGAGATLLGTGGVDVGAFTSLAARVIVFSTNDDYQSGALNGPTVPYEYRSVLAARVSIGAHTIVGGGSVILPGVTLGRGAGVGALSLVKADVSPGQVVAGTPARPIRERDVDRLDELERRLRAVEGGNA